MKLPFLAILTKKKLKALFGVFVCMTTWSATPPDLAAWGGDKAPNSTKSRLVYKYLTNASCNLLISLINTIISQDRRYFFAVVSGAFALPPLPSHAVNLDHPKAL